jgi:hypothetical protein
MLEVCYMQYTKEVPGQSASIWPKEYPIKQIVTLKTISPMDTPLDAPMDGPK